MATRRQRAGRKAARVMRRLRDGRFMRRRRRGGTPYAKRR